MNPALDYLITGTVVLILVGFFGAVAYITYRVLRYGERNYGGESALVGGEPPLHEPPPEPPPPPPEPPARPRRRTRRRR